MSARLVRLETAPDLLGQVDRRPVDATSEGMLASGQRITQDDSADQLAVLRQPVPQRLRVLKKQRRLRCT